MVCAKVFCSADRRVLIAVDGSVVMMGISLVEMMGPALALPMAEMSASASAYWTVATMASMRAC